MDTPPPDNVAVSVRGVSKAFDLPHERVHTLKERAVHPLRRRTSDRLQALDDVSFEVQRGEFFGMAGRNGSGKSTLMKCLAGIYRADAGQMWLRGRMAPFIELGVGFNPDLTARDNVLINAIMLGLSPTEAHERYDAVIEFAELERFVDLKLKNYSSGMHVRLAFSVMVHVSADLLLIDEVLAVGDASFQRKCQDALEAASAEGQTILLVTHDMAAIRRFCHRALLLEEGRLVAIGDSPTVAQRYEELNLEREGQGGPRVKAEDGDAAILDTWFEDAAGRRAATLEHASACAVAMRVEFRSAVTDPVFGLVLSDEQRRPLFATNSAWSRRHSGEFGQGDRVDVHIRFENVLASGRYFASPQVGHLDPARPLMDYRLNAASAVVHGARETGGAIDLPHDLVISPLDARLEAAGR